MFGYKKTLQKSTFEIADHMYQQFIICILFSLCRYDRSRLWLSCLGPLVLLPLKFLIILRVHDEGYFEGT